MKIDFKSAVQRLQSCEDVLILTHANPDGDTLGGAFALLQGLRQCGKRAKLHTDAPIPPRYAFLAAGCAEDCFDETYIISVDVADKKLLGSKTQALYGDRVDLSIDHHGTNRMFAKETYVESDSASASEVVYLLLCALGVEITKPIADCLYTGCATDTGCFRYSNVTARTHRIVSELIARGADHAQINTLMFETKKPGFLRLEQQVLSGMELFADGRICVLTITRAMLDDAGCGDEDIDELVALSRQMEGVRIGATFKERPDGSYKLSLRTHEDVDASAICAVFGGGGHARAAGCSFSEDRDTALQRLLPVLRSFLKEGAAR